MLPVSLTFAGALALVALWLAYRVVRVRMKAEVMVGDGGHALLTARMRAQANFVEYTPFVLILMVLIEMAGGSAWGLRGVGALYVIARVLHAFGMDKQTMPAPLRGIGASATWLILFALAIWAIWLASHGPAVPAVHYL
ncbi:MAPEG family protein [uncultured Sphingomonas sp.]|jgi:uncharacterized membrane protein YecN with MAPEG domain|uniref:MAPEG family protein n=1 Tax=uncultured Sphingomonas sp. TaxID=158754 RepID=UPI0026113D30|nr:MAPEG family protein [uncultured Sphingomonas sp.]